MPDLSFLRPAAADAHSTRKWKPQHSKRKVQHSKRKLQQSKRKPQHKHQRRRQPASSPEPEPEPEPEPQPELTDAELRQAAAAALAVENATPEQEPAPRRDPAHEPEQSEVLERKAVLDALRAVPLALWTEPQVVQWAQALDLDWRLQLASEFKYSHVDGPELAVMEIDQLEQVLRRTRMAEDDIVGASQAVLELRNAAVENDAGAPKPAPRLAYMSESFRDEVLQAHFNDVATTATVTPALLNAAEELTGVGDDETENLPIEPMEGSQRNRRASASLVSSSKNGRIRRPSSMRREVCDRVPGLPDNLLVMSEKEPMVDGHIEDDDGTEHVEPSQHPSEGGDNGALESKPISVADATTLCGSLGASDEDIQDSVKVAEFVHLEAANAIPPANAGPACSSRVPEPEPKPGCKSDTDSDGIQKNEQAGVESESREIDGWKDCGLEVLEPDNEAAVRDTAEGGAELEPKVVQLPAADEQHEDDDPVAAELARGSQSQDLPINSNHDARHQETLAATKIAAAIRGKNARQRVARIREKAAQLEALMATDISSDSEDDAAIVQPEMVLEEHTEIPAAANWVSQALHGIGEQIDEEIRAAVRIQAMMRGKLMRNRLKDTRAKNTVVLPLATKKQDLSTDKIARAKVVAERERATPNFAANVGALDMVQFPPSDTKLDKDFAPGDEPSAGPERAKVRAPRHKWRRQAAVPRQARKGRPTVSKAVDDYAVLGKPRSDVIPEAEPDRKREPEPELESMLEQVDNSTRSKTVAEGVLARHISARPSRKRNEKDGRHQPRDCPAWQFRLLADEGRKKSHPYQRQLSLQKKQTRKQRVVETKSRDSWWLTAIDQSHSPKTAAETSPTAKKWISSGEPNPDFDSDPDHNSKTDLEPVLEQVARSSLALQSTSVPEPRLQDEVDSQTDPAGGNDSTVIQHALQGAVHTTIGLDEKNSAPAIVADTTPDLEQVDKSSITFHSTVVQQEQQEHDGQLRDENKEQNQEEWEQLESKATVQALVDVDMAPGSTHNESNPVVTPRMIAPRNDLLETNAQTRVDEGGDASDDGTNKADCSDDDGKQDESDQLSLSLPAISKNRGPAKPFVDTSAADDVKRDGSWWLAALENGGATLTLNRNEGTIAAVRSAGRAEIAPTSRTTGPRRGIAQQKQQKLTAKYPRTVLLQREHAASRGQRQHAAKLMGATETMSTQPVSRTSAQKHNHQRKKRAEATPSNHRHSHKDTAGRRGPRWQRKRLMDPKIGDRPRSPPHHGSVAGITVSPVDKQSPTQVLRPTATSTKVPVPPSQGGLVLPSNDEDSWTAFIEAVAEQEIAFIEAVAEQEIKRADDLVLQIVDRINGRTPSQEDQATERGKQNEIREQSPTRARPPA